MQENAPIAKAFVLDTNVLIHDPNAILNFDEHLVIIPMTVLEELDKLKAGNNSVAADCRSAIRLIDSMIGELSPEELKKGVPLKRAENDVPRGRLAVIMNKNR